MEVKRKICKKCNAAMESKGKMDSGNSLFEIWKCVNCGEEEMVCIGLVQR